MARTVGGGKEHTRRPWRTMARVPSKPQTARSVSSVSGTLMKTPLIDSRRLNSFCKDRSQQLAEGAAKRREEAVERINTIEALSPEFTRIDADLAAVPVGQRAKLDEFVKAADERLARIRDNFAKGLWTDLGILPMSPDEADRTNSRSVWRSEQRWRNQQTIQRREKS